MLNLLVILNLVKGVDLHSDQNAERRIIYGLCKVDILFALAAVSDINSKLVSCSPCATLYSGSVPAIDDILERNGKKRTATSIEKMET